MRDVIIIGAGPAGLQAALTLGRMHRTALLVDSGAYRNGTVRHMHNVIANDGTPPADFRRVAREQLDGYATVEALAGTVDQVESVDGGFGVTFEDGRTESASRLLLATGMADELPDIEGLASLWGLRAFSCPFCDGHEFAGRRIGLVGESSRFEHLVRLLRPIAAEIVVFDGEALEDGQRLSLQEAGAAIHPGRASAVAEHGDGVRVTAGEAVDVAGLFVATGPARQRAPFAAQLGLTMLPSGAIEIDDFGRTSRPGVWAAGDIAHRASLPGAMASVLAAAAAGQLAAASVVQELAG
ncbi:MAG: thioredoxin reductase [Microbacterium sp. 69-10]|uniref:NAD(P)/FAD-dependent oxidoreductase n=1 Tax=Microbacterium sp. 69-10 TaxID=1895783 RepID=UPI0009691DDB|nr:NAD(P)/FAD-dependent oxidoreductase [Microbacterium sp. 69-10]OJU40987.1 MAG: thioredoxin reductase [Microbacterium sp. 69-10]